MKTRESVRYPVHNGQRGPQCVLRTLSIVHLRCTSNISFVGRANDVCFVSLFIHRAIHTTIWTSQTSADPEQGAWSASQVWSQNMRETIRKIDETAPQDLRALRTYREKCWGGGGAGAAPGLYRGLITMNPGVPSQYLSSLFNLNDELSCNSTVFG